MRTDTDKTALLLQAILAAPPEAKDGALRLLRGELTPPTPAQTGPLLLTMGSAAALAGISRSSLWRMIRMKKIAPVEILPGTFRVPRIAIERIAGLAK